MVDTSNLKFLDNYSRSYHVHKYGIEMDLILVTDGPYKLPKIAVLTSTAHNLLRAQATKDRIFLAKPVPIDAAMAALVTDEFIGSLELPAYL